jgi:hypothetical protein
VPLKHSLNDFLLPGPKLLVPPMLAKQG